MFDRLIESTNERRLARTWLYFAASTVTWSVVLAGVAIAGVFLADAQLDANFEKLNSLVTVSHPSPAPPLSRRSEPVRQDPSPPSGLIAISRPSDSVMPPRPPSPYSGPVMLNGSPTGSTDGRIDGLPDGVRLDGSGADNGPGVPAPTPPQPATDVATETRTSPVPSRPRHIGVINGLATRRVEPPYPEIARVTGIQGAVVVSVTVSETGRVLDVQVVSGHPTLRQASIDAARRWQFTPTILNGIPTKVIGTITFNFRRN